MLIVLFDTLLFPFVKAMYKSVVSVPDQTFLHSLDGTYIYGIFEYVYVCLFYFQTQFSHTCRTEFLMLSLLKKFKK